MVTKNTVPQLSPRPDSQCVSDRPWLVESAAHFIKHSNRASKKYAVDQLIVERSVTLLLAPTCSAKTTAAIDMAVSVSSGTRSFDFFETPSPGPVLFIYQPGNSTDSAERVKQLCENRQIKVKDLPLAISGELPDFSKAITTGVFRKAISGSQMVVVDTLNGRGPQGCWNNGQIAAALARICFEVKTTLVVAQLAKVHRYEKNLFDFAYGEDRLIARDIVYCSDSELKVAGDFLPHQSWKLKRHDHRLSVDVTSQSTGW